MREETCDSLADAHAPIRASMRPRADARGHLGGDAGALQREVASLRPRAEARGSPVQPEHRHGDPERASMRPRANARGNSGSGRSRSPITRCFTEASRRCARTPRWRRRRACAGPGFNEASRRSARRHRAFLEFSLAPLASMRPRAEARGNPCRTMSPRASTARFNEASRRSARKPTSSPRTARRATCFNEASRRSARTRRPAASPRGPARRFNEASRRSARKRGAGARVYAALEELQ